MPTLKLAYRTVLVLALLPACQSLTSSAAPQIERIEPSWVFAPTQGSATISGRSFFAGVHVSLDDDAPPVLDQQFVVHIAEVEATLVSATPTTLEVRIPTELPVGFHNVAVTTPGGLSTVLEQGFEVRAQAQLTLSLEDAPGGLGNEITQVALGLGETANVYAVGRDPDTDEFVSDLEVSWNPEGGISAVPSSGTSTSIVPSMSGPATLTAVHETNGSRVLEFTIGACEMDNDCLDPCYPESTCAGQWCEPGAPKDSDGDTFVDINCPGGTDCDDDPGACGMLCHPDGIEGCDGWDNDCDAATSDGADDPMLTLPCDGNDLDLCEEGVWTCVSSALVCDDVTDDDLEGPMGSPNCSDNMDNDCDGDIDLDDISCTIANTPPIADFFVDQGGGVKGTTFTFDASQSWDREDSVGTLSFSWDWNSDGAVDEIGGMVKTHSFATAGLKEITVRVADPLGLYDHFHGFVYVAEPGQQIVVDVNNDNIDAGDGGTSLREAIELANTTPGPNLITFDAGMIIQIGSSLQQPGTEVGTLTDTSPTYIMGRPGVIIDGSSLGGGQSGMIAQSDNNGFMWLDLRHCNDIGIVLQGNSNRVAHIEVELSTQPVSIVGNFNTVGPDNSLHDNVDIGVNVRGSNNRVVGNLLKDNKDGIAFHGGGGGGATGNIAISNTILRSTQNGVNIRNNTSLSRIENNTIQGSESANIKIAAAAGGVSVHNNIIHGSNGDGIAAGGNPTLDNNLYFGNMDADCSGCNQGANELHLEPQFIDPIIDDLRLQPGSPCIDAGVDRSEDVNGNGAGDHYGMAPDIGGWEAPDGY